MQPSCTLPRDQVLEEKGNTNTTAAHTLVSDWKLLPVPAYQAAQRLAAFPGCPLLQGPASPPPQSGRVAGARAEVTCVQDRSRVLDPCTLTQL